MSSFVNKAKGGEFVKKIIALILALVLLLSHPVVANASSRSLAINPIITFGENRVHCYVAISADAGDPIIAKISLYEGNNRIRTWNRTGTEYLIFSEYVPVQNGYKYTLTVDATVEGIKKPTVSVDATYVQ